MAGEVKLSATARKVLGMASIGKVDITWDHPDAKALVARGLVKLTRFQPGSAFVGGCVVEITEAGREALRHGR